MLDGSKSHDNNLFFVNKIGPYKSIFKQSIRPPEEDNVNILLACPAVFWIVTYERNLIYCNLMGVEFILIEEYITIFDFLVYNFS